MDEPDECEYGDDVYNIAAAVQILRPELALGRAVRDLMDDPTSRLAYLARDMLEACLLPLIPRMNAVTNPDILRRRYEIVPLECWPGSNWDNECFSREYDAYQERCAGQTSDYDYLIQGCTVDINNRKHVATMQLGQYQVFLDAMYFHVARDRTIVHQIDNPSYLVKNWHYLGYGVFVTFSRPIDMDDRFLGWDIHGFQLTPGGRLIEVDYVPYLTKIKMINILPCGLAYCLGFEPRLHSEDNDLEENIDSDADDYNSDDYDSDDGAVCVRNSVKNVKFGEESWCQLMDFSVYPPKSLRVERVHCGFCPASSCRGACMWDYIDDYGQVRRYPGSAGTSDRIRSRSSMWNAQ